MCSELRLSLNVICDTWKYSSYFCKWAAMPGKVPLDICAQWKFRSVWSESSLDTIWIAKGAIILHENITKTRLFKYIENFTTKQNGKFSDKTFSFFSHFFSKHRLWVLVRTALAKIVPTIYVFSKLRKIMYTPVNPSFTIKLGFKGVKII